MGPFLIHSVVVVVVVIARGKSKWGTEVHENIWMPLRRSVCDTGDQEMSSATLIGHRAAAAHLALSNNALMRMIFVRNGQRRVQL